ncbi:MAG: sigma-70 family RNA polymerase sigma factor [Actinomycetota bacterium]|nr:sigma-70 family RNA polymerase sigma factor [Actinomycetota bacterium]
MATNQLAVLASRAISGDARAVDELLEELRPLIVRTVRLIVGAGSWAAEDAAQEALIDVMRGIASVREPEAVRAWAMRVASARAVKVARRERFLRLVRSTGPVAELAGAPPGGDLAELKSAFDELPARMRAVAVLRLWAGLSEEETAAALGCATGTVKSQLHDARRRLAETLGDRGVRPQTQGVQPPTERPTNG